MDQEIDNGNTIELEALIMLTATLAGGFAANPNVAHGQIPELAVKTALKTFDALQKAVRGN